MAPPLQSDSGGLKAYSIK